MLEHCVPHSCNPCAVIRFVIVLKKLATNIDFRLATLKVDILDIVFSARVANEESRFGYIPFSEVKVYKTARRAFAVQKRHAVMIARKADQPVGFVNCSFGEYHIGTGVLLTTIHNMNVLKSVRSRLSGGKVALGLMRGVETLSQARNVSEILFHVTSGVDLENAHRFAKRNGYALVGGSYALKKEG